MVNIFSQKAKRIFTANQLQMRPEDGRGD